MSWHSWHSISWFLSRIRWSIRWICALCKEIEFTLSTGDSWIAFFPPGMGWVAALKNQMNMMNSTWITWCTMLHEHVLLLIADTDRHQLENTHMAMDQYLLMTSINPSYFGAQRLRLRETPWPHDLPRPVKNSPFAWQLQRSHQREAVGSCYKSVLHPCYTRVFFAAEASTNPVNSHEFTVLFVEVWWFALQCSRARLQLMRAGATCCGNMLEAIQPVPADTATDRYQQRDTRVRKKYCYYRWL